MALETLTEEESVILDKFTSAGRSMAEDEVHMIANITQGSLEVELYRFEKVDWRDVDPRFTSSLDYVPYSEQLHGVIESLVKKRYLKRDERNPIVLHVLNGE